MFRRRNLAVVWATMVVMGFQFIVSSSNFAHAQRRSGTSRWRQMQAAQRQQEINQLQQQIENAQKLLESVTTQGTLTQGELESARQAALSARQQFNAAQAQDREIAKKIRRIEEKILDAQSDDSAFAKAVDEVHQAQKDLDVDMHRALGWKAPAENESDAVHLTEMARLTAAERDTLKNDPRYQEKKTALQQAMNILGTVKQTLFEADSDWKSAQEEHHRIDQEMAEKKRMAKGSANDSLQARGELRTAEEIAATARASMAQARMRLRQLGGTEKAPTQAKPSTSGNKK